MTERASEEQTDADVTAWAKGVAATVTPAELARKVADNREQGRNPRRAAVTKRVR